MHAPVVVAPLLVYLLMTCGCARAEDPQVEPHGTQVDRAADKEAEEVEAPRVWSDELPEEVEAQVAQAVERAITEYSLTEADTEDYSDRILGLPYHDPVEFDHEIQCLIDEMTEARWRTLPSLVELLQKPDAAVRSNALEVLSCVRAPFKDPNLAQVFTAEAYVPVATRSTYEVHPRVRELATDMLGGVARLSGRHGLAPAPDCVFERLEELLQDPSPDIVRSAARSLYVTGHRDLLTPEQIEEFENGPKE